MLVGWDQWLLARILTLFFGLAYIMIWIQVTIWHIRGKFHRWQMWIPVILLPCLGFTAILVSIWPLLFLGWLHTILSIVGIIIGLYGTVLHLSAIKHRTGGWKFENFMVGPPFVLPFIIAAISLINLIITWY